MEKFLSDLILASQFFTLLWLSHACAQAQVSPNWIEHNRYLEAGVGIHQQAYREQDRYSLTPDGTLNTETGKQSTLNAALRWQTAGGWFAELATQRQSGATDYSGYLQHGNGSLTPYQARTGNVANQARVQIGYALNVGNWPVVPAHWQFIPVVQLSQHHWRRNLTQYSETYRFNAYAVGAIAQWRMLPGMVLEAQALAGHTAAAQVSAPELGFASTQAGGSLQQWQLAIIQDLAVATGQAQLSGWRIVARYAGSHYSHGTSPIVAGLQAPPNKNAPRTWTLGVQKQF